MLILAVFPGQTLFGAAFLLGPCQSFPILVSNLRPERTSPTSFRDDHPSPGVRLKLARSGFLYSDPKTGGAPPNTRTLIPVASDDHRTGYPGVRGDNSYVATTLDDLHT